MRLETPEETQARCRQYGAEWLGDRIEFRVRDVQHDRGAVRRLFTRHDLDGPLPKDPRPETLLKRASGEGRQPKGYLSRAFVSPNPDTPLAIHVTKVSGSGEAGDSYDCLARVRFSSRPNPVTGETEPYAVALPPEGQDHYHDATAAERARWIADRTNELITTCHARDLALWIRTVLDETGAAKSLGAGNNYYLPASLASRFFDLFNDLQRSFGVEWIRDPKTTLGAPHVRAEITQAAQRSLARDVEAIKDELQTAIEKQGGRKRNASLKHQIERIGKIQNKIDLYRKVAEAQVLKPLEEVSELYRQHFGTLLDGGELDLDWADVEPEQEAPEPVESETERVHEAVEGDVLCASSGDSDLAWVL